MKIGGGTRLAAVLGWPVAHSKSPAMHNAAFVHAGVDAVYVALPVAREHLESVVLGLKNSSVMGVNLTVPHKAAVIPLCDRLSEAALAIGAVNTLEFCEDGTVVGHNTDALGYVRAFEEAALQPLSGLDVVILGGGGAARAVAHGVGSAGARSVQVVARSPEQVSWTSALPWKEESAHSVLPGCDVLIDCTSIGLHPETEKLAMQHMAVSLLPKRAIVSSLVYHRQTQLLADASARGLTPLDGLGMLLHQGALAFEIWTGRPASIEVMRRALLAL